MLIGFLGWGITYIILDSRVSDSSLIMQDALSEAVKSERTKCLKKTNYIREVEKVAFTMESYLRMCERTVTFYETKLKECSSDCLEFGGRELENCNRKLDLLNK